VKNLVLLAAAALLSFVAVPGGGSEGVPLRRTFGSGILPSPHYARSSPAIPGSKARLASPARGTRSSPRFRWGETFPDTVLWAWEHPQDLRWIDPNTTCVAHLALTLRLADRQILRQPRQQVLRVPPGTRLVAVARIETGAETDLGPSAIEDIARDLVALARPGVVAIQVDFDAARSERAFYRALLERLRATLPDSLGLSMTALASWCLDDPWLQGLPVDEIVPMVFRMGRDGEAVRRVLADRGDFPCAECRGAIGLATDEPAPLLRGHRRVYLFQAGAWSLAERRR